MNRAALYFFDHGPYPSEWEELTDNALLESYKKTSNQLIVCFLMKRHRTPIIAISYSYLKNQEAVEDFVHNLFIRLVDKLKDANIQRFTGFLVTMVKNKHKDELSKHNVRQGYENEEKSRMVLSKNEEKDQDFILDNPLSEEKLEEYFQEGILSEMEYTCLRYRSQGLKPADIVKLIDPRILGLYPKEGQMDCPKFILRIKKKVFGALDRAYRKMREKLGNDYDGYFQT